MQFEQFISRVQETGNFADEGAATAVAEATLTTLGARITGGEARDAAAQLPEPLSAWMSAEAGGDDDADAMPVEDFLVHIDDAVGSVDGELTTGQVGAVLSTLREALRGGEADELLSQLPPEIARLAR